MSPRDQGCCAAVLMQRVTHSVPIVFANEIGGPEFASFLRLATWVNVRAETLACAGEIDEAIEKSIRWGPVCAETPTAWRQEPPQRVANARSGLSHQGRRRENQSASPLYARRILGGRQQNAIGSIVSPYPVAKEQRARRRLQALRIRRKL